MSSLRDMLLRDLLIIHLWMFIFFATNKTTIKPWFNLIKKNKFGYGKTKTVIGHTENFLPLKNHHYDTKRIASCPNDVLNK